MIPRATCRTALVAGLVLLAGCKKEAPPPKADKDVTGTLADEIEVDPRLVGQPSQVAANVDLAPAQRSPAAIAAAKAEAARLAGGPVGALPPLVEDEASHQVIAEASARLSGGSSDCAAKVASGKAWARFAPATPSARSRPAFTWGPVCAMPPKTTCASPLTTPVTAGALPL